ncbi:MAG: GIY-YIG nuclease family protein [Alphaproteobacteria bacterium]|nr:GIY-YIG nuclease family protein [Alphaproteobacteria bacterium]
MRRGGWVYIVASRRNGTLYLGVTSDLARRQWEHRNGLIAGFSKRYGCTRLVWYEHYADIRDAIDAESRMKAWRRQWKLQAIETINPDWDELIAPPLP